MAITTENSTQIANTEADPPVALSTHEWHGRVRRAFFEFTQGGAAGDAGSIARLVTLPPGKVRLYLPGSRVAFSAMGTARTMDLGWEAYTNDDGVVVGVDPNGLDDGVDVASAGAVNPAGTIGSHETVLFESRDGVTLTAQVNDGTIPAAATISGWVEYVQD